MPYFSIKEIGKVFQSLYEFFKKKQKRNTKENKHLTASNLTPCPSNYSIHQKELWHINVKMDKDIYHENAPNSQYHGQQHKDSYCNSYNKSVLQSK